MNTKFIFSLLTVFLHSILAQSQQTDDEQHQSSSSDETKNSYQCQSEIDLDFETCNLSDLSTEALREICDRIGLDVETHVLPYLYDDDADPHADSLSNNNNNEDEETKPPKTYTHADYIKAAEECLLIEEEMERLAAEDPEMLDQLEREALAQDPEILADVISDILSQDDSLLKEIVDKLSKEKPDLMSDIEKEGLLEEGETLGDRPDVVGYFLATLLSEDPSLLDEFDALLSEDYEFEEFEEEEQGEDGNEGNGIHSEL
mmetsp:Transcript_19563/g.40984  ORF Transcript_19563/g.40984 Transcript_19563/m.40984 type:complete len:260 (-) Transcript_19563:204-983(-)